MKAIKLLAIVIVVSLASGCAAYRTNSDVTFDSTVVQKTASKVKILETGLADVSYASLGTVEAVVKKLTLFHKDPTKEQVNIVLIKKGEKLGADAVINVIYNSGVGMLTWGYMEGVGEAVKIQSGK